MRGQLQSATVLRRGERLPRETAIRLQDGAQLVLDYPGGAFVRVQGPALVAVAPLGEAALLLREGLVTVDVERAAMHPDSGFWLATPLLRAELVQGARFVLRTAPTATRLTVVSGTLTVHAPQGSAWTRTQIAPGQTLTLISGGAPTVDSESPARLEQAEQSLAAAVWPGAERAVPSAGSEPLETACARLEQDRARERELQARHRSLLAQKDPAAMELQRATAQQGAQSFRDERELRILLSLWEAGALGLPASASGQAPTTSRARALLGAPP
jgi:hypothetical protein